jgi:putative tricarboxylic transport membrane protein
MRRADVAFGATITAVGTGALIMAFSMPFFSENTPGPGFFPRFVSSGLIILGILQMISGFRPARVEVRPVGPVSPMERTTHGKAGERDDDKPFFTAKPLIVIAAFILSVPILAVIGFVPTIALLLAFLFLIVERRRDIGAYAAIVIIPILTWLLFAKLLGMEMPEGMLHLGILGF